MWGRLGFFAVAAGIAACGSSTDRDAPTTEQLIADACGNLATASCATQAHIDDCNQDLTQKQSEALSEGCEAELDAYLGCAAQSPIACASPGDLGPIPSFSNCSELSSKFSQCWSHLPAGCSFGVGSVDSGGGCTVTCPSLKATCEGPDPNGPVSCTCDEGPHAGATFDATNCSENLSWATGHACNY